jgi:uncharacterized cofD-like protein
MRAIGELRRAEDARAREGASAPVRVVAVGGGTGLPRVLSGLAGSGASDRGRPLDVTAVVATSDDGGSSGELRRSFGIPAPGDIRNCLVALCASADPIPELLQHRFQGSGGLSGHTVGNVVLAALAERLGGFREAVELAGELLEARGRVLPATEEAVDLVATLEDGRVVRGECAMVAALGRVKQVALDHLTPACPAALQAIAAADLVVLGPGSLYSSIVAPLLASGMSEALRRCRGTRVLVVNLSTERGETDGYGAADHVRAVQRHIGAVVDVAVVHDRPHRLGRRTADGTGPVAVDARAIAELGVTPFVADLAEPGDPPRHDPAKLARVLLGFARTE